MMNLTFTKPQRLLLFVTYGWDVNQSTLLWLLEGYALFGAIAILLGGTTGAFLGALIYTFVIPISLMTTYPALAMLGRLRGRTLVLSLFGSCLFALLARFVWLGSIGKYTSASS